MGGGLIQLVAIGNADSYLTSNPHITYWKSVYKRYSPFAIEAIMQTIQGSVQFGQQLNCELTRDGDLIKKIYFEIDLPSLPAHPGTTVGWVNSIGHAICSTVEFKIGEQTIDTLTSEWMDMRDQLYLTSDKYNAKSIMISRSDVNIRTQSNRNAKKLYVDLPFWFSQSPGSAIPYIALQLHKASLSFNVRPLRELIYTHGGASIDEYLSAHSNNIKQPLINVWVDYVYLEITERKKIAMNPHEYLISQLQFSGIQSSSSSKIYTQPLVLNHPVKELIWAFRDTTRNNPGMNNDIFNYSPSSNYIRSSEGYAVKDVFSHARLLLNGHDRFSERESSYFRLMEPHHIHTSIPKKHVYCYGFCIKPEQEQPSGSLNFSRVDSAQIRFQMNDVNNAYDFILFATNYNVLKIENGQGGLVFAS